MNFISVGCPKITLFILLIIFFFIEKKVPEIVNCYANRKSYMVLLSNTDFSLISICCIFIKK